LEKFVMAPPIAGIASSQALGGLIHKLTNTLCEQINSSSLIRWARGRAEKIDAGSHFLPRCSEIVRGPGQVLDRFLPGCAAPIGLILDIYEADGLGHGPTLLSTDASGRCWFGQATFAGAHGNGRDAPLPAIREAPNRPSGSTHSRHPKQTENPQNTCRFALRQ
jgi:hypothetical protein